MLYMNIKRIGSGTKYTRVYASLAQWQCVRLVSERS